ATETVDPRDEPAFEAWGRIGGAKPVVVYEAVGVPGMLDDALKHAPLRARILVVGVCMERDTITPYFGIAKELTLHFALGYEPDEFAASLRALAEGEIDVSPMITTEV